MARVLICCQCKYSSTFCWAIKSSFGYQCSSKECVFVMYLIIAKDSTNGTPLYSAKGTWNIRISIIRLTHVLQPNFRDCWGVRIPEIFWPSKIDTGVQFPTWATFFLHGLLHPWKVWGLLKHISSPSESSWQLLRKYISTKKLSLLCIRCGRVIRDFERETRCNF